MADQRAYSPKDLRRAVNLAAFLGWSFFAGFILLETFNPLILPWVALFGLPIAFGCAWLIGAPLLWRMMKRPITWTQAALGGGAITAAIAALSIGVGRFMGWRQSQNEAFSSRLGGDGYIRSVDGILTPYGWWVVAQNTALFILLGCVVALIVRSYIGAGRANLPD